ncbi:MAG: hypothetical protein P8P74_08605, partial [Crocinitomicaceae bacterium]|nr:hypothetical protein [Crocinitomicaceae bacterium]
TYTFYLELKMVKDNALICILGNARDPYKGGSAFYDKNAKNGSDFWFEVGYSENVDCDFFWSDVPAVGTDNKTATGTINGIKYTYKSSEMIEFTNNVFAHNVFPSEEGIPNIKCIKNTKKTSNTITFEKPMTDPVLVFSSIGNQGTEVPIKFSNDFQVEFNNKSMTKVNGRTVSAKEGYIVLRFPGQHKELSFEYTAAENYANFVFGAATCKPAAVAASTPDITNTSGSWHYGYGSDAAGSFTDFSLTTENGSVKGISQGTDANSKWWSISQNTTNAAITDGHSITYPAKAEGVLVMHPGIGRGNRTKVKYTASATGSYNVAVEWTLVDNQRGVTVNAEVLKESAGAWSKESTLKLSEYNKPQTYTGVIQLEKGESILFEIENDGDFRGDSTKAKFNVSMK